MLNNDQQNTTQETKDHYLLQITSIIHNKYVVNQNLEHVDDVSFRNLLAELEWFFNKIRYVPSYHKVSVSTLAIPFNETQLDQLL
jgi:hypothetical protein